MKTAAIYAQVSSDQQRKDKTIVSQTGRAEGVRYKPRLQRTG